jgi:endonuclease/exonuclease/phosphatase family metal-dependent hydrolase
LTRPILTLLSWNLFLGSGAPRHFFDHLCRHWNVFFFERGPRWSLEPLAELILEHDCDVVCLQEVDGGSWRNRRRNLVQEIAQRTGLEHHHFAAQRRMHCNDGIALLSRHPLRETTTTVLVHDFEQRGLIRARVEISGRSVWVAVTHLAALPFNGALRRRQAEHLARELDSVRPLLVGADFNCEPDAEELAPLRQQLELKALISEPTFPTYRPRQRLDNVFASPDARVIEARVLPSRHSDHLPVLVKIEL